MRRLQHTWGNPFGNPEEDADSVQRGSQKGITRKRVPWKNAPGSNNRASKRPVRKLRTDLSELRLFREAVVREARSAYKPTAPKTVRISVTMMVVPLVLVDVVEVFVGGGGGLVPWPGPLPLPLPLPPSANTGEAIRARAPEKTSNRIAFFMGEVSFLRLLCASLRLKPVRYGCTRIFQNPMPSVIRKRGFGRTGGPAHRKCRCKCICISDLWKQSRSGKSRLLVPNWSSLIHHRL